MTLVLSDSSQELFCPFFPWIVKEITRISFFDNDASIHKNNPGGHIPGKPDLVCYHDGGIGFQRMNIACPRPVLEEALQRIESAVSNL